MSVPENPRQTKNPITLKIKFKSSSLEQFIERYSVDVSKSGIFIRTKEPLAVGTQLRFEFLLNFFRGKSFTKIKKSSDYNGTRKEKKNSNADEQPFTHAGAVEFSKISQQLQLQ